MPTLPIYTPTKDQQEFINQLNTYITPMAKAIIHNNHACFVQYKFVSGMNNLFINAVTFERSDRFYLIIEELSQMIFKKPYNECIQFDNTGNVFRFIDNIS